LYSQFINTITLFIFSPPSRRHTVEELRVPTDFVPTIQQPNIPREREGGVEGRGEGKRERVSEREREKRENI
jgi:hypothetical protein